jgi:hypothetical protein
MNYIRIYMNFGSLTNFLEIEIENGIENIPTVHGLKVPQEQALLAWPMTKNGPRGPCLVRGAWAR